MGWSRALPRHLALLGIPLLLLVVAALIGRGRSRSGPYVPERADEPLERLPLQARDPAALELRALERAVRAAPSDVEARVALAERCIELYRTRADPRYLGQAQAALGALFDASAPPARARLLRAVIRQSNHEFGAALADLDHSVQELAAEPQPWLTRAVVRVVLGRYDEALGDCAQARFLAGALVGAVCDASPLSLTDHGEQARRALLAALAGARHATRTERAWALSALAEVDARLGRAGDAASHFGASLALDPADPYTLAAYADWLLDERRPERVVELLRGMERMDALLLRLAIAERRLALPSSVAHVAELGARFDAARLRGDPTHRREESRFALELARDSLRALELARANWDIQREVGDARALLEAALAARQPRAAQPVVAFARGVGLSDPWVRELVARVESGT